MTDETHIRPGCITIGTIDTSRITFSAYWRGEWRHSSELTERDMIWLRAKSELEERFRHEEAERRGWKGRVFGFLRSIC